MCLTITLLVKRIGLFAAITYSLFLALLRDGYVIAGFMSSGLVRNWVKSSLNNEAMRDTLGPAQFQQPASLAQLRESLSNETCVPPSAVDSLASVLQQKLHSFHFFELQLVRQVTSRLLQAILIFS